MSYDTMTFLCDFAIFCGVVAAGFSLVALFKSAKSE